MNPETEIQKTLNATRFAVLATQGEAQPHVSLVAFTPIDGISTLAFATLRQTRKYRNILRNGRVALFIGDRTPLGLNIGERPLLTAHGLASDVSPSDRNALVGIHRKRHPELAELLTSRDSALILVHVATYQIVAGLNDVRWYETSKSMSS